VLQITGEIMQLHHSKHHNAYVTNFNAAHEKLAEATHKKDISAIISQQQAIKFNGGGHLNHSIFWKNLCSPKEGGGHLDNGDLKTLIDSQFGSLDGLQQKVPCCRCHFILRRT
jgi:Fe-Mn family superoxide dismutase